MTTPQKYVRHHQSIASVNSVNNNNHNNNNNLDSFDPNQIYSQDITGGFDSPIFPPTNNNSGRSNNNNNNEDSGLFFWNKRKGIPVTATTNNNNKHTYGTTSHLDASPAHRDHNADDDFHHLYHSPDRIGLGGSLFSNPVTRTVIATISHTVGVGILCLAFAMHNASLGVCVVELVVFCFVAIMSDYILVVACEHTKQFSQQSLLSYCICGSPENMFDTPMVSRNFGKSSAAAVAAPTGIMITNNNNNTNPRDTVMGTVQQQEHYNAIMSRTPNYGSAIASMNSESSRKNNDETQQNYNIYDDNNNNDGKKETKEEKKRRHEQKRQQEENAITKLLKNKSGDRNGNDQQQQQQGDVKNKNKKASPLAPPAQSMGVFAQESVLSCTTGSMSTDQTNSVSVFPEAKNAKTKSAEAKKASEKDAKTKQHQKQQQQQQQPKKLESASSSSSSESDEDDVHQSKTFFSQNKTGKKEDKKNASSKKKSSTARVDRSHSNNNNNNNKDQSSPSFLSQTPTSHNNKQSNNDNSKKSFISSAFFSRRNSSKNRSGGGDNDDVDDDDDSLFNETNGDDDVAAEFDGNDDPISRNNNHHNNYNQHHQRNRAFLRKYKQALEDVAYYRKATLVVCDTVLLVGALCLLVAFSRVIVTCCSAVLYKMGVPAASAWVGGAAAPWFVLWGCFFFVILSWKRILFEPPIVAAIKVGCIVFLVLCMVIRYGEVYYSKNYGENAGNNNNSTKETEKHIRYWGFYAESLSALATLSLVCSYHVQTPVLYSLIQPRSPSVKMKAAWISNPITTLFFIMTGLIGYLSFGDLVARDNTNFDIGDRNDLWLMNDGGDILNQYPRDSSLFTAARAIMILHFAIAFPILAISVRESIHRLVLVLCGRSNGMRDMNDVLKTSRVALVVEALFLVLFVQVIAATVPGIGIVLNLGGAISSSFSFLIVPGIVGIYVFEEVDPEKDAFDFDDSRCPTTANIGSPNLSEFGPVPGNDNKTTNKVPNQMEEGAEEASIASPTRSSLPSAVAWGITKDNNSNNIRDSVASAQSIGAPPSSNNNYHDNDGDDGDDATGDETRSSGYGYHNDTSSSVAGRRSRYADSVLRSAKRNDITGWFGARLSAHTMRYVCRAMLTLGIIVTVGGTISSFLLF